MPTLTLAQYDDVVKGHYPRGWRRCTPDVDGNLVEWSCSGGKQPGRPNSSRKCPTVPEYAYTTKRRGGAKTEKRYCLSHYLHRTKQL